jgi:hypothetical protein
LSFISTATYLSSNSRTLGEHMKMMKEDQWNRKLAIMVDADEEGIYCKFTKPVQDRPTLFLKLFKEWEPKVLVQVTLKHFWIIEREQELRGTL